MKHTRLAAGLAATVMAASGLVAATSVAAQARPDAQIWGRVLAGNGKAVLNANVVAKGANGQASALSYDVTEPGADAKPGFFGLFVGSNGTYTVTVTKSGYDPVKLTNIVVKRHHRVVGIGNIKLLRTSKTSAAVLNEVHVGDKAKVRITVDPSKNKPSGRLSVTLGKQELVSEKLLPSDNGHVTVKLPKLPKGGYDLKASFDGGALYAPSSDKFTLTVKKPANRSQVPNARPAII